MTKKAMQYTDKHITTLEGLSHIRKRPTGYIPDVGLQGLTHAIKEIIDNSVDETPYMGEVDTHVSISFFHSLKVDTKRFWIGIQDSGRGVPTGKLQDSFTRMFTSGKFDQEAYKTSSGLFGIGAKVSAALSKQFRVITNRVTEQKAGTLYLENGVTKDITLFDKVDLGEYSQGTTVVFELDMNFFPTCDEYITEGIPLIVDLLKKLNIFDRVTRITCNEITKEIPSKFWEMDLASALSCYRGLLESKHVVTCFRSDPDFDTYGYLQEIWDQYSPLIWSIDDANYTPEGSKLGFQVKLYLPKLVRNGRAFSMVNNVAIKDMDSSQYLALYNTLRSFVEPYIEDASLKAFFMTNYKFPLFVAMSISYEGAEFSGTTKNAFRNPVFEEEFMIELTKLLSSSEYANKWEKLAKSLLGDIENKYNLFYNKPVSKTNNKKLTLELNFPLRYNEPEIIDPALNELFLVEGDSAAGIKYDKNKYQAMYALRGKVLNLIKSIKDKDQRAALVRLGKNLIYQDLMLLFNIRPNSKDLSTLSFRYITIMTDADPDGAHIAALALAAIHAINKLIIEQGRVRYAAPPLYVVGLGTSKNKMFLKDRNTLIDMRISYVYSELLDIELQPRKYDPKSKLPKLIKLTNHGLFREFCYLVTHIGEMFAYTASTLSIPELILEKLVSISGALHEGKIDIDRIRQVVPSDMLKYNEQYQTLIVSQGDEDIIIPLKQVVDVLYEELLPFLNSVKWSKFDIFVTTKTTDHYKKQKVSIVELYQIFETMNDMFKIKRYKGLGGMQPEHIVHSCMNPQTRAYVQITDIGDLERIYALLGDNVDMRKEMHKSFITPNER